MILFVKNFLLFLKHAYRYLFQSLEFDEDIKNFR